MSKTLLLLKLLQGHDVRSRSLLPGSSRQSVYATLQINQEVEVRSITAKSGGATPEFNQLFMMEMGPWWKGKDLVIQLFARNKIRRDAFIGGCSCKLGELMRACGLEGEQPHQNEGAGFGSGGGLPPQSTPLSPASRSASQSGRAAPVQLAPNPQGLGGAVGTGGAQALGLVSFQRVSAEEVRQFGELLPVLEGQQRGGNGGAGDEGFELQPGAANSAPNGTADTSLASASSSSAAFARRVNSSLLPGAPGAAVPAPLSLPVTWLILRHGGGPSALKQYPAPLWHLPAGRLAIYLDYVHLPPNSIPKMMGPAAIERQRAMSSAASSSSASPAGKAPLARTAAQQVQLPSTILPNGWVGMSDNEKLAWAHSHRRARLAPLPQPMGGLVSFVARGLLGSGANPAPGSPNYPVYGSGGVVLNGSPAASAAGASPVLWPVPWCWFQQILLIFLGTNPQDRVFYSWYGMLGFVLALTEIAFTRGAEVAHAATQATAAAVQGVLDAAAAAAPEVVQAVSVVTPSATALVLTSAASAASASGAEVLEAGWFASLDLPRLYCLLLSALILKLGWNMLNDHQISHPWRRLDLIASMLLGLAIGAASLMGTGPASNTAACILGALALAGAHAYARATLYQMEIVAGVMAYEYHSHLRTMLAIEEIKGGRASSVPFVYRIPLAPLGHWHAVAMWSARSMRHAGAIGFAWVTGKASHQAHGIPGSVHLCLRSAFFLCGSIAANWLWLPIPASLHWMLDLLTVRAAAMFAGSLFGLLLLFMFGRDSPRLKGKPWLLLFGADMLLLLYSGLSFLPLLLGLCCTALLHTLWTHCWGLLALAIEWFLSAAFVPADVWSYASEEWARVANQQQRAGNANAGVQLGLPPPPLWMGPIMAEQAEAMQQAQASQPAQQQVDGFSDLADRAAQGMSRMFGSGSGGGGSARNLLQSALAHPQHLLNDQPGSEQEAAVLQALRAQNEQYAMR